MRAPASPSPAGSRAGSDGPAFDGGRARAAGAANPAASPAAGLACIECGTALPPRARFCPECGVRQDSEGASPDREHPDRICCLELELSIDAARTILTDGCAAARTGSALAGRHEPRDELPFNLALPLVEACLHALQFREISTRQKHAAWHFARAAATAAVSPDPLLMSELVSLQAAQPAGIEPAQDAPAQMIAQSTPRAPSTPKHGTWRV